MVFHAKEGVDVEKTVVDTEFKIATNSKLFSILSDSIYTRKIDAVIRELCCNAYDAHIEARQDIPFQVTLPDEFVPEFRVRDFGLGLCPEDMQMYTTYGESTKSRSNAYIGAFGIGAKSPFAYTNTFNVTSYHGGTARSYSMFVEAGTPRMTLLGEAESSEPTGLEVFFSVAEKDIDEFREKTISICALMHDTIEFLNVPESWRSNLKTEIASYQWEPAQYIGDGFMVSNLELDINTKQDVLNIIQGNVSYEMHLHEVTDMLKFSLGSEYTKIVNRVGTNFHIAGKLKVPNGTFVPHPSRERLTFDEFTKAGIKCIFQKVFKYYVTDAVDRVLAGLNSYYELHTRLKNYSKLVTRNIRIAEFCLSNSHLCNTSNAIKTAPIRNYDEWRNAMFSAISILGGKDKGWRFKAVPQMSMYGELIDRIYYSSKYPLSVDQRFRIIHDTQRHELKRPIILTGHIGRLFTSADKATFIDVKNLPKLTREELALYKKVYSGADSGPRVTKDNFSFLTLKTGVDSLSFSKIYLSQKTASDVTSFNATYPVYWVTSNRRYEMRFSDTSTLFDLKVQKDLNSIFVDTEFLVDHNRKLKNIPWKTTCSIGIVILPEGHELQRALPNLIEEMKKVIRITVSDFLGTTFYGLDKNNNDVLFTALAYKHPDLLMDLIRKSDFESFFTSWFAAGKPESVARLPRYTMPFSLLPDGASLCHDYQSNRNVHKVRVSDLYEYIARNGYPLLDKWVWRGEDDKKTAEDVIFYLKEKNKQIVLQAEERN